MDNDGGCGCIIVLLFALVLVFCIGGWIYLSAVTSTAEGTVMNTFVSKGETYINVQLDSGGTEVFSNNDNLLRGKFNSNDLFTELEVGEHYHFYLSGKRIPVLSEFRNILKITQTPKLER